MSCAMDDTNLQELEPGRFSGIPSVAFRPQTCSRPTSSDMECLLPLLEEQHKLQEGCRRRSRTAAGGHTITPRYEPLPTEKHGYWAPLLAAALGELGSKLTLPDKLKGLGPLAALDVRRFAPLCNVARKPSISAVNDDLKKICEIPSWEPLGSKAMCRAPVPLYVALLAVGADEAAASARSQVQEQAFREVRMARFSSKGSIASVRHLAKLQWLGADWLATDRLKRTPLHILCATMAHQYMSSVLHTSSIASVARFLCNQAPQALFLEDAENLTPLNYLVAPFRGHLGCVGSAHHELLLAVVEGLLGYFISRPVHLISALQDSFAFASAVQGLAEHAQRMPDVVPLTNLVAVYEFAISSTRALHCANTEWRLGMWQARDVFDSARDLRLRVHILHQVAGNAFGNAFGSRDILSETSAQERIRKSETSWAAKQNEYEARILQLQIELGRIQTSRSETESDDLERLTGRVQLSSSSAISSPSQISGSNSVLEFESPSHLTLHNPVLAEYDAVCEAKAAVARVRSSRLIDIDFEGMSEVARNGVASVRASLSAAVHRLAQDLYELESHFVMELVQNADDNRYSEAADEPPTLRLALLIPSDAMDGSPQPAFFFSANNEEGLRPEDVVAMCDVNASSKRSQPGCTGHKGIGWKSTFAVSDCPYVLSGACTFKFDTAGPLGQLSYVTPTWVTPEELSELPSVVLAAHAAGGTVIYLPLREAVAPAVAQGFKHLEDHHLSLLFFRRLQRLQLEYPNGRQVHMKRVKRNTISVSVSMPGDDFPQVAHHTFILHREALVLPGEHVGNLTLAFPLNLESSSGFVGEGVYVGDDDQESTANEVSSKLTTGDKQEHLPPHAFYVGLPVRPTGFCFAIDGPFDLIASRGELHEGSAVNEALCDAVPIVFAAALQAHPDVIGPRALAFIGEMATKGPWQRVRRQLISVLCSVSCIPTEDGELALPGECVQRPRSSCGEAASELIPPELLLLSCGKRFARNTRATGSLRGVTVATLGLEHWLKVLRYRGALWPYGLLGAALREGTDVNFFRILFTWFDEEVRLAEHTGDFLQQIWDIELFPSASPGHVLLRLADGPIFRCFCDKLPEKWQRTLCVHGVLRLLDPRIRAALDGYPGAGFLNNLVTVKSTRTAIATACIEWHLLRFRSPNLEAADSDAIWASLACLMEVFLAEEPLAPSSTVLCLPLSPLEADAEITSLLRWWRDVGDLVWIPTLGGVDRSSPPIARASELVCASYLGVAGAPADDVKQGTWSEQTRSLLCHGSGKGRSRSRLHCSVAYDYCRSSLGKPIRWEAFFDALGMMPLRPALNGLNAAVSGNLTARLGACLISEEWWIEVMQEPLVLAYVHRLFHSATPSELAWLQALPIHSAADKAPCCVSGYFLHDAFARLGGRYLSYVRLPPAKSGSIAAREKARSILVQLGISTEISPQSLLRCLAVLRADAFCKDAEVYADFYKEIASLDVSKWVEGDALMLRKKLAKLVYVPSRGFMKAADCTWEDGGMMQWLAEVPSLRAYYERYGPTLRHFFLGVVETPETLAGFAPSVFVHAVRRLVEHVDTASQDREAVLSSSPISAKALLEDLGAVVMQLYGWLIRSCEGASVSEHTAVRSAFAKERLLLIVDAGLCQPKRLNVAEAWWDVEADLVESKVADLAIYKHYGNLPGAEAFFLRVLGLRRFLTRSDLMQRETLPEQQEQLSHWCLGLSIDDLEQFVSVQTSNDFRPADWRGPEDQGDEEEQADAGGRSREMPETAGSREFQPPTAAGAARHPPAWRSRESMERDQQAERARKAHEEAIEETRRRALEEWKRNNPTYFVHRNSTEDEGTAANTGASGADSASPSGTIHRSRDEAPRGNASVAEAIRAGRRPGINAQYLEDETAENERERRRRQLLEDRLERARQARATQREADRLERQAERQQQSAELHRAWEQRRATAESQVAADQERYPEQLQAEEEHQPAGQQRLAVQNEAADHDVLAWGGDLPPLGSQAPAHPERTTADSHDEQQTSEDGEDEEVSHIVTFQEIELLQLQIVEIEREVEEHQNDVETLLREKDSVDQACQQYVRMIHNFWQQNLPEQS